MGDLIYKLMAMPGEDIKCALSLASGINNFLLGGLIGVDLY